MCVAEQEKTWKNRRSQRLDKMALLDLQSSLQSEIQAKETIRDELRNAKALQIVTEKYALGSSLKYNGLSLDP